MTKNKFYYRIRQELKTKNPALSGDIYFKVRIKRAFYPAKWDAHPNQIMSEEKNVETHNNASKKKIPEINPGMTIRVYQKIKELNIKGEEKERTQYFEGIVIAKKHGKEKGGTITVRKVSDGVGVEKIFPLNLPTIEKIEVKKQEKVRRAKLYFLRKGYKKKLKEKKVS